MLKNVETKHKHYLVQTKGKTQEANGFWPRTRKVYKIWIIV